MKYPYSDKYMTYDFNKHRYILTNAYITEVLGIDLMARLKVSNVSSTTIIDSLLNRISNRVYNYLFTHNDRQAIEYLVAKFPSARAIMKDALGEQAIYVLSIGDQVLTADESKQKLALSPDARSILDNQELSETCAVLTYTGHYCFVPPSYENGGY